MFSQSINQSISQSLEKENIVFWEKTPNRSSYTGSVSFKTSSCPTKHVDDTQEILKNVLLRYYGLAQVGRQLFLIVVGCILISYIKT